MSHESSFIFNILEKVWTWTELHENLRNLILMYGGSVSWQMATWMTWMTWMTWTGGRWSATARGRGQAAPEQHSLRAETWTALWQRVLDISWNILTHTHTHIYIYIFINKIGVYIYIYILCIYIYIYYIMYIGRMRCWTVCILRHCRPEWGWQDNPDVKAWW